MNAAAPRSDPRPRASQGFSLAEAALATAIAALALTTLLGLVPQGLGNLRAAGETSAQHRICRQLFGVLAQEDWRGAGGVDSLAQRFDRRRFYFDDQAVLIEAGKPDAKSIAHVAELLVPAPDTTLPGAPAADPYLRRVVARIVSLPQPDFDFDKAEPSTFQIYATQLANTGP